MKKRKTGDRGQGTGNRIQNAIRGAVWAAAVLAAGAASGQTVYTLDLDWKELAFTNRPALGETPEIELRNIGASDPTNLTMYLSNRDGDMLAVTEGMVATGDYARADLDLTSTNLLAEFEGLATSGSKDFDFSVWDSGKSLLLCSAKIEIRHNPLWESLAFTNLPALETLGLAEYLVWAAMSSNATESARYQIDLPWKKLEFDNTMALAERAAILLTGIGDAEPAGLLLYLSNRDGDGLALASGMVATTNAGEAFGILNLATTNLLAEFENAAPTAEKTLELTIWDSARDRMLASHPVPVRNNPLAAQFVNGWTNVPEAVETELMESINALEETAVSHAAAIADLSNIVENIVGGISYGVEATNAYRGDMGQAASNLAASAYAAATNAGTNATAARALTLAQSASNGGFAGTESIGPLRVLSSFYGIATGTNGATTNEFNVFAGDYAGNNVTGSYNTALGGFAMRDTIGHPHGVTFLGTHAGEQFNFGTNSGGTLGAGAHALHYSAGKDLTGVGTYALYASTGNLSSAFGYYAGGYSTSTGAVMVGMNAGLYSFGKYYSAIGISAGYGATGDYWSALGGGAGSFAKGTSWIAAGRGSGYATSGDDWSAFGRFAGRKANWTNSAAVGITAGMFASGTNRIFIDAVDAYGFNANPDLAVAEDFPDYSATNNAIFVDNGAVSLGRGGSYSNMLPQTNTLRGTWMVETNQLPGIDWAALGGEGGGISLADATNVAEAVVGAATTNDMPGIDWGSLGGGAGTITGATVAEGTPLAVTTNAGVLAFTIPPGGTGTANETALGDPYVLTGTNVVFSPTNNWVQSWVATSAASQISFAIKTNAAQRIGAVLDITATTFPIQWLTSSPPVRVVGNIPSNAVSSWRIDSAAGSTNLVVTRTQ